MTKSPDHSSLTVDERVQDRHRTVGDTGVWVDLFQHYEDASVIVGRRMRSPNEHAHKRLHKAGKGRSYRTIRRRGSQRNLYLCKCKRSKSPFSSCCASSCRQWAPRSSCQPLSSLQALFRQQVPFRQWWRASFQRLWEAFWIDLRLELENKVGWKVNVRVWLM